jgi:hypothetical protein
MAVHSSMAHTRVLRGKTQHAPCLPLPYGAIWHVYADEQQSAKKRDRRDVAVTVWASALPSL